MMALDSRLHGIVVQGFPSKLTDGKRLPPLVDSDNLNFWTLFERLTIILSLFYVFICFVFCVRFRSNECRCALRFVAHDAFLERIVALLPWCSSVCPSKMGVHCDQTVHVSADVSIHLDSPMFWDPDTKACPPTPSRLFPVLPGREVGYGCAN